MYHSSHLSKWNSALTYFIPMFHFYATWKHETKGFLTFSGGTEMEHWGKMSQN